LLERGRARQRCERAADPEKFTSIHDGASV
jgi:hypothetical protein